MRRRLEKVVRAGDGTRLVARETAAPDAAGAPFVCANGIGVSTFFWKYVEDHFSHSRPVITWDYRGHGRSEYPRDLRDLTVPACAEDLGRVLDAFGHRQAVLLGHSMGCQVIYEFARSRPDRVQMLVPILGTFGRPIHTFLDRQAASALSFMIGHSLGTSMPRLVQRLQRRALEPPLCRAIVARLARLTRLVHPRAMREDDLDAYLDHLATFPPLVFFRLARSMAAHTVGPDLESIAAPTLIIAGEWDAFTPLYLSEEAADRLPNARLVVLPEGSHAALVEQPEKIHREIEGFLIEHRVDRV